jgi:hypothetical protein
MELFKVFDLGKLQLMLEDDKVVNMIKEITNVY